MFYLLADFEWMQPFTFPLETMCRGSGLFFILLVLALAGRSVVCGTPFTANGQAIIVAPFRCPCQCRKQWRIKLAHLFKGLRCHVQLVNTELARAPLHRIGQLRKQQCVRRALCAERSYQVGERRRAKIFDVRRHRLCQTHAKVIVFTLP